MLFCYRYLGNYQKTDIMWSAYCKKQPPIYGGLLIFKIVDGI